MRINIKPVALVFILLAGMAVNAQEKRNLSLDEAITLSLQNSKEIKLNAAKVAEANGALREARERRLPDLTASGSYLRLNQPNVDMKVKLGGQSGGSAEGGSSSS